MTELTHFYSHAGEASSKLGALKGETRRSVVHAELRTRRTREASAMCLCCAALKNLQLEKHVSTFKVSTGWTSAETLKAEPWITPQYG